MIYTAFKWRRTKWCLKWRETCSCHKLCFKLKRYTLKETRYTFKASIGLRFRKQRLPLRRISFNTPRVCVSHVKHGGNTGLSRCNKNTTRMCPEHSKLLFWLGNGYVKVILTWSKIYFCQRFVIRKGGSIVIRTLCRSSFCWPLVP